MFKKLEQPRSLYMPSASSCSRPCASWQLRRGCTQRTSCALRQQFYRLFVWAIGRYSCLHSRTNYACLWGRAYTLYTFLFGTLRAVRLGTCADYIFRSQATSMYSKAASIFTAAFLLLEESTCDRHCSRYWCPLCRSPHVTRCRCRGIKILCSLLLHMHPFYARSSDLNCCECIVHQHFTMSVC
jgi:hypothetical protein